MFLTYFLHLNSYLLTFLVNIFPGHNFGSFSSVTSTLKLKTQSQLTQSPFMGTDCLFVTWRHFFLLLEEMESSIQIFLKNQALIIWSSAFLFLHFCTNLEDLVHFYSETVGSHTSSDRDRLHVAMQ